MAELPFNPQLKPTDTADYHGSPPPAMGGAMDLNELLRHLEDARPLIIADLKEDGDPPARYLIGAELGSGSVGQVIEARDQHLGRQVAIKILHDGEGMSRDGIARFISEAQITAQLEHPAVVPVHEIGIMPGGMPYFSMKLVKGRSLEDILNLLRIGDRDTHKHYNQLARLRLFQRLCQGMAYAHAKGVVHRDLKPSNILIGEYGEAQIMDWGLAKATFSQPLSSPDAGAMVETVRLGSGLDTFSGVIAGTPAYMSPEQARGEYAFVGPASDVFSLGLILAEFMSLMRVNRHTSFQDALNAAKSPQAGVDAAKLAPREKFGNGLVWIISKATQPDISSRYADAKELSDDIARLIEEHVTATSQRGPALSGRRTTHPSGRSIAFMGRGFWRGAAVAAAVETAILILWRLLG